MCFLKYRTCTAIQRIRKCTPQRLVRLFTFGCDVSPLRELRAAGSSVQGRSLTFDPSRRYHHSRLARCMMATLTDFLAAVFSYDDIVVLIFESFIYVI